MFFVIIEIFMFRKKQIFSASWGRWAYLVYIMFSLGTAFLIIIEGLALGLKNIILQKYKETLLRIKCQIWWNFLTYVLLLKSLKQIRIFFRSTTCQRYTKALLPGSIFITFLPQFFQLPQFLLQSICQSIHFLNSIYMYLTHHRINLKRLNFIRPNQSMNKWPNKENNTYTAISIWWK